MLKKHYNREWKWIEKHRFQLLLLATITVLILPAFSGGGLLGTILFVTSMSFLFIQSMIVASGSKSKRPGLRYFIVAVMIIVFWFEPAGYKLYLLDIVRFCLLALFFIFVTIHLVKFLKRSQSVNLNVILTSINIYLLIGIISGSLTYLCFKIYADSYNLPANISEPNIITFLYYSFITMSTVGYGDITPRIPETQTLAYIIAVTGQLYMAIVIAMLVGKYLIHRPVEKDNKVG